MTLSVMDRFDSKWGYADLSYGPWSPCWAWTDWLGKSGYGQFFIGKRRFIAHRFSYEHYRGAVPSGLELDHLCRVRHCVNPYHLEPVTHAENMRRGDNAMRGFCVHGHPFDAANTRWKSGKFGRYRRCLTCHRLECRARKARNVVVPAVSKP